MKTPHVVKNTTRPFWRCFAWRPSRMVNSLLTIKQCVLELGQLRFFLLFYWPNNSQYFLYQLNLHIEEQSAHTGGLILKQQFVFRAGINRYPTHHTNLHMKELIYTNSNFIDKIVINYENILICSHNCRRLPTVTSFI